MPKYLDRFRSAVDQLPSGLDFEVSNESEAQSEAGTSLSQDMDSLLSRADSASQRVPQDDGLGAAVPHITTPGTSVSRDVGEGSAKRAKKTRSTK